MKRDMELIRLILLEAEGETEVDLSRYSEEQIDYHKSLLYKQGFINGTPMMGGTRIYSISLTWEGHDFLDDARDDKVWREAMSQLGKAAGTASLEVLKSLLVSVATRMLTGGQP